MARRTGRTTAQMKAAPAHAVFVWGNGHLNYALDLAKVLGRRDLVIINPAHIGMLRDRPPRPVVVDHGAKLSADLQNLVTHLNAREPAGG